jgi:hypothetical protein
MDSAIRQPHTGGPPPFTPTAAPIDSLQPRYFANSGPCGERLNVGNLAQNLEAHWLIVSPSRDTVNSAGTVTGPDVSLVLMLDLETEVEMKLPGRFKVSPQIAGAIKVSGVADVQTL